VEEPISNGDFMCCTLELNPHLDFHIENIKRNLDSLGSATIFEFCAD
jgi:hypothetical protein